MLASDLLRAVIVLDSRSCRPSSSCPSSTSSASCRLDRELLPPGAGRVAAAHRARRWAGERELAGHAERRWRNGAGSPTVADRRSAGVGERLSRPPGRDRRIRDRLGDVPRELRAHRGHLAGGGARDRRARGRDGRRSVLAGVRSGLRIVRGSRVLTGVMLAAGITMLGLGAVNVLFVPLLVQDLGSTRPGWPRSSSRRPPA